MILRFDETGVLRDPGLHDGYLLGISVDEIDGAQTATLLVRSVEGTTYRLCFPNVVRLRVTDFLEGNIIFEFSLHRGDAIDDRDLRYVYGYGVPDDARRDVPRHNLADKCLLSMSSSYGAKLCALVAAPAEQLTFERL